MPISQYDTIVRVLGLILHKDKEFVDEGDVHVNQLIPDLEPLTPDQMQMPFPNEHACRIASPDQFTKFRRNNDTNPNTIIGFKSDGESGLQSFRYPTSGWTAERARSHCESHSGSFAAASKETQASETSKKTVRKTVERDSDGRISAVIEETVDG